MSVSQPAPAPLPNASATARGAVSTTMQHFKGLKIGDDGFGIPDEDGVIRHVRVPVRVTDYGALGDGATNDRQAVQDAIDAAVADGSRWIHFPDCADSYRLDGADLAPTEAMFVVPSDFMITWDPNGPIFLTGASFLGADEPGYYNDWVCFRVPLGGHDVLFDRPLFFGENGEYDGTGFLKIEQSANACIEFEASTIGDNTRDVVVRGGRFFNLCGFSTHSPGVVTHCEYTNNMHRFCANGVNINAYNSIMTENRLFETEGFECAGQNTTIANNIGERIWGAFISAGGDTTSGTVHYGMVVNSNSVDIVYDGHGIFLSDACCMSQAKLNTVTRAYGFGIFSDTSSSGVPDVQNWGNALNENTVNSCGGLATAYGGAIAYTLGERRTSDGWTWVCRKGGVGGASGPAAPTADPYTYRRVVGATVWGALNVGDGSPNKIGIKASGSAGRHSINGNHVRDLGLTGYQMLACIGINGPDLTCVDNKCKPVAGQLPIVVGSSSVVYLNNNTNENGGLVYNIIDGAVIVGDAKVGRTLSEIMYATARYEEVFRRWGIRLDGTMSWGDGTGPEDITLGLLGSSLAFTSTTRGLLPPRMTTAQRNALSSPAAGTIIFNTTTTKLEVYDGGTWQGAW